MMTLKLRTAGHHFVLVPFQLPPFLSNCVCYYRWMIWVIDSSEYLQKPCVGASDVGILQIKGVAAQCVLSCTNWLVVWNMAFIFPLIFHILGIS